MADGNLGRVIATLAIVAVIGAAAYVLWQPGHAAPLVGIVRATEIRVAPEVGGQLVAVNVKVGDHVGAGDIVAQLSAIELNAAVGQARAGLAAAVASRDHVYAGVRAEEVAGLAAEIAKAKSRLQYAQAQLTRTSTLARTDYASQQSLNQAQNDAATAQANVDAAEANHAAAVAGPTREERATADTQVQAAAAALAVLERQLEKTVMRAPADGTVTVVVAEIGENISAGEPVLTVQRAGAEWMSFNAREDTLRGLSVGSKIDVLSQGTGQVIPAIVTELTPLGSFATWQAERAVGDHDLNTLRLRIDPVDTRNTLEPGMTVWVDR
jgi:HlyD family secretion protein